MPEPIKFELFREPRVPFSTLMVASMEDDGKEYAACTVIPMREPDTDASFERVQLWRLSRDAAEILLTEILAPGYRERCRVNNSGAFEVSYYLAR